MMSVSEPVSSSQATLADSSGSDARPAKSPAKVFGR